MRWLDAIDDYKSAVDKISDGTKDSKERFQLGVTYRRVEGKLFDSIAELKKACETPAVKPNYINNLGLSYFEADMMPEAEHQFQLAITLQKTLMEKDKSEENRENLSFYHKNKGLAMYH